MYDLVIIGGGIVGMATAYALTRTGKLSVLVLEAERELAQQQTGHNSGVIHSGLYYKPGSLKARNCADGRERLFRFCAENGIAHERCGKVVVAVNEQEVPALRELERRGLANGLKGVRRLSPDAVREREPHVVGVEGLLVPETGIVDFVEVTQAYARLAREAGVEIRTDTPVTGIHTEADGLVVETNQGPVRARYAINCGGLFADRIAQWAGAAPALRIIPFRGTYYKLKPSAEKWVRHLIYPVPDPRFPFLGVHFTRMIHGGIEAGPNAVLTFRRRWYEPGDNSSFDFSPLTYCGFWRMVRTHGRVGAQEAWRVLFKTSFVRALQRLIPDLRADDVIPYGSGIRAQAVTRDGVLADDFRLISAGRMIHVLNAPSPAATASLSIGETLSDMARQQFDLS